jgi:hypothetical protein
MIGFLEGLVRRGAGLEPPAGQQLLKLRPLSRFESTSSVGLDDESSDQTNTPERPGDSAGVADRTPPPDHRATQAHETEDHSRSQEHQGLPQMIDREQDGGAPAPTTGTAIRGGAPSMRAPKKAQEPEAADVERRSILLDSQTEGDRHAALRVPAFPTVGLPPTSLSAAEHVSEMTNALQPSGRGIPETEGQAPHLTISIGRIEIDFEKQAGPSVPPKQGPLRTRGFTAYAHARRGILR